MKQARDLGLKNLAFVTLYGGDPYTLNQLKDDAIGMYHSQGYSMRVKTPENEKMIAAYHAKHKNDKDFLTWWPYAQIGQNILGWRMAFAAVEKAGSLDPEKIINAFEGFRLYYRKGTRYGNGDAPRSLRSSGARSSDSAGRPSGSVPCTPYGKEG